MFFFCLVQKVIPQFSAVPQILCTILTWPNFVEKVKKLGLLTELIVEEFMYGYNFGLFTRKKL